ncbi:hypothetical protein COU15_02910 [Candidatus Kaiserbacteria bacterium CG10_big_fil_rev_8_21_14_0_10_45_20]|uniref:Small ribosomal subunit protein bS6 n=1 Tax=Candidatus Kaiserbacteria bacterium CG10_big_fil_rev_8_21_14_0_10_45_20 TaxID=1974607 RepID=A0A2H0UF16_9BACT|nr:MAG: hypothetical protein COU15_02910 [Candidatus Kaiserbacteria bacterium CG10_big_fil_rev_8_21_14_0_10_45_20]
MTDSNEIHEVDTSGIDAGGEKDATPSVYEIGFHLLPTLEEASVANEVATITEMLNKLNIEMVGERFPVKIPLAYTMDKKIDGTIRHFDEAYFGWIAGVLTATAIEEVKGALDAHPQVLRYLITKTSKDAVLATLNDPSLDIGAVEEEETEEVSEKELDEALDAIEEDGPKDDK